jgi:hypothetical protein
MGLKQNICYNCGDEYKRLSAHWSKSACEHPKLSKSDIEILTGVLMGDGCIDRHSSVNSRFICTNTSKEYLQYLDEQLEHVSCGVRLDKTAEESSNSSAFLEGGNVENYSDIYRWESIYHPDITESFQWYESGTKKFPENIELTPTVLKHWFCCDGHFEESICRIRISMSNEINRKGMINRMFNSAGLPEPSGFNESKRVSGGYKCGAYWGTKESERLWEYMGKPLPGFRYKWPERFK